VARSPAFSAVLAFFSKELYWSTHDPSLTGAACGIAAARAGTSLGKTIANPASEIKARIMRVDFITVPVQAGCQIRVQRRD
jgi:hypothetical protein